MLQLVRSLVTVAVGAYLVYVIFNLRGELAAARARAAEMPAVEAIMTRTSVRQYAEGSALTPGEIETLERAALAAPTACNAQPWEVIAVTEPEKLSRIAEVHPHAGMARNAAAAFIICGGDNGLKGIAKEYWIQDCSAATENLLLAAHAIGLGAVWCGVYPIPERVASIKELFAIPEGYTPLNVICVGRPVAPSAPKNKWKPEKIHLNRW